MEEITIKTDDLKKYVGEAFEEKSQSFARKEDITSVIQPLEEVIKAQGERLNSISVASSNQTRSPLKHFINEYKKEVEANKTEMPKLYSNKAWDSLDTFTITAPNAATYPANGSPSNVGANILSFYRQMFEGISVAPTSRSRIMDFVTVRPLVQYSIAKMSKQFNGDFDVVDECALKPELSGSYDMVTAPAKTIAATWKVSNQYLRYFDFIAADMVQYFGELLNDKIPNQVLADLIASASPFTVNPGIQTEAAPNNFDALVALYATLEANDYMPNAVLINPVAYANMVKEKASDGHYRLSNGMSVNIVSQGGNSVISINGYDINVFKDSQLGVDQVIIGDLSKMLVGLSGQFGFEFYGVTGTDSDGQRNLKQFVLEQDIATLLPTVDQPGIISTTFTAAKTAITV